MALTTLSDMKQELKDNWEQFTDNQYPHDLLTEFADSACPIYFNDIINEWHAMPSEFGDVWAQEAYQSDSIFSLMLYDLCNYYNHLALTAYNELCDEMEPEDA